MARSQITRANLQGNTDDGALIQSLVHSEQLMSQITFGWITNLNGFTLTAATIEANNSGLTYSGGTPVEYPRSVATGATRYPLGYSTGVPPE